MQERDAAALAEARSLLYRSQILQVNTRLKALDEIYMCSLAPFQVYVLFQKFDTNFANFDAFLLISREESQNTANFAFFRENFADFSRNFAEFL